MEVPVYQSPWIVEQMAKDRQEQIRADMKQIHLAEKAMKSDHLAASNAKVLESSSSAFRRVALTLGRAILAMIG